MSAAIEIKFCGLMRPEDAAFAASLGARYVGVIFADGPRTLTAEAAEQVLANVPPSVARVGVFGKQTPDDVASTAARLALDVVQLHGAPDPRTIGEVRNRWSGQVWAVQRVNGAQLPDGIRDVFDVADAVVLDARVDGKLGGTGVALPWEELRDGIGALRARRARVVLAGGLEPDNVTRAMDAIAPHVVDVSSGVESSPGIKDHERMRAFRDAVRERGTRR